ncbi:MAG TPA: FAD-dependent oxidoreductase [Pirellulaceae bacterium]|nr:FAD-dependent oxidoreductase [Pirellulaceae bacterium]
MTFDVIVVGAGGSGLAAAYSAAEHGGRVLVFEKRPQPGGTTGIAVGSFTAAGTSIQHQAGVDDSPELHIEDAGNFPPVEIEARNADAMRAFFLREAATTFEWLRGIGLSFVGPSPEPPNRQPRMHNVVPGAKAYIAALQLGLQRKGAVLVSNASVERLLRNGDRVVGVRAVVEGKAREYLATRGVILAAGDYANNRAMIAEYKGEQYREIEGINPFATGDGHKLAKDAGAMLVNMDVTYGPELRFVPSSKRPFQQWLPASGFAARVMGAVATRLPNWVMRAMIKRLLVTWQHPENALFDDGAMLLNRDGQRFVDETRSPDREIALAAQPGKIAYILLDGRLVERYSAWPHFISTAPDIAYAYVKDYQRLRPDVVRSGTSLEAVSRRAGLDANAVRDTVRDYNASPRERNGEKPCLEAGPWVLLGPVKSYFTTTEGGAVVNQQMQVLEENGSIIPGLYAVGQNGLSGMILWSHGLHIAWAMTSGRLAGIAVMQVRPAFQPDSSA